MTDATKPDFDKGEHWGASSVKLSHPFTLGGVFYESVSMREPTGHDMEAYFADQERTTVGFMKGLTELPAEAWARMHGEDWRALLKKASGFLL